MYYVSKQYRVMIMTTRFVMYLVLMVLCGCASQVPILIQSPPDPDPDFLQVKQNIKTFQNQNVRWGGKIISVENKHDSTWIEILAGPLDSYGEPSSSDNYEGRFIARINGFLDPEHYSKDRYLTIFGTIETEFVRRIDEHPYTYPLVSAKEYYMWPEYRTAQYSDPYYYGHFYPYYGFHYGYGHPFYYGFHYPSYRHHLRFHHFH